MRPGISEPPSPKLLLLVDDDLRNLALLEGHLASLGHRIALAKGGREALEAFDREEPDLVLLDVMMPDLDGIDVLTHIRARTVGSYVPIVMVTALSDRGDRLRGLEAGADDFLEKPIDASILLARVRTLLRLKQAYDELSARNALLERLQREQRELTSFIVHDLKNPLAVVHLNVAWAREQLGSDGAPEADEALADAEDAASRMQGMVGDILRVSQLEEAVFPFQARSVALAELIEEVARAHQREASRKAIELVVSCDAALTAVADPSLLRRVLENLVENGLRHTPPRGRVELRADDDGDAPRLIVANTGSPVPVAERDKVFDRFHSAGPRAGNAGLGLYFCRRAVEAHKGTIEVTELPEWPVAFVVRLPAA
jgi:signal transduction histidine kinase